MPSRPPSNTGSSPLTRGKPDGLDGASAIRGLIPTHAGKTRAWSWCRWSPAAHPHSRGENANADAAKSRGQGSSPLTRGKHAVALNRIALPRLIPTHAGKTLTQARTHLGTPAHPHSRGENQLAGRRACLRTWLIPTHAGKTTTMGISPLSTRAHPHSRGENDDTGGESRVINGSSPLTRGKRGWRRKGIDVRRLIPAHAGKTAT